MTIVFSFSLNPLEVFGVALAASLAATLGIFAGGCLISLTARNSRRTEVFDITNTAIEGMFMRQTFVALVVSVLSIWSPWPIATSTGVMAILGFQFIVYAVDWRRILGN